MSSDITALDAYVTVGKIIQAVDPNMLLDLDGVRHKDRDSLEEWLQFNMLFDNKYAESIRQQHSTFSFQLMCFSLASESRTDKSFVRHMELANIYRPYLEQRDYMINNACLRLKEVKIAYLDLRTSTFTAKGISTGGVPPLQVVCAVLQVDATLIQYKG